MNLVHKPTIWLICITFIQSTFAILEPIAKQTPKTSIAPIYHPATPIYHPVAPIYHPAIVTSQPINPSTNLTQQPTTKGGTVSDFYFPISIINTSKKKTAHITSLTIQYGYNQTKQTETLTVTIPTKTGRLKPKATFNTTLDIKAPTTPAEQGITLKGVTELIIDNQTITLPLGHLGTPAIEIQNAKGVWVIQKNDLETSEQTQQTSKSALKSTATVVAQKKQLSSTVPAIPNVPTPTTTQTSKASKSVSSVLNT